MIDMERLRRLFAPTWWAATLMLGSLVWFIAGTIAYVVEPDLAGLLAPLSASPLIIAVVVLVLRSERIDRTPPGSRDR